MARFTVKTANPEYIRRIANKYLSEDWITFSYLSSYYEQGKGTISALLYRGIAEDILSDDVSNKIFNKVVYAYSKGIDERSHRWEKAFNERSIFRKKQADEEREQAQKRELILQKIELIKYQIANYVDIEDAPPLEELENNLFRFERELERL